MSHAIKLVAPLGACLALGVAVPWVLDPSGAPEPGLIQPRDVHAFEDAPRFRQPASVQLEPQPEIDREPLVCEITPTGVERASRHARVFQPARIHRSRFESGDPMEHGLMRGTARDGHWVTWWPGGVKREEGAYDNGRKVGVWITWHRYGQVAAAGSYCDGRREGFWTYWYPNGYKWMEGYYAGGDVYDPHFGREGLWTTWYRNGTMMAQGELREGRRTGCWREWDRSGVTSIVVYPDSD